MAWAGCETTLREHVLWRGIRPDLGKHAEPARDLRIRRTGKMKCVIERQKQAEHFTAANDGDGAIADAKLCKRLRKGRADRIP